MSRRTPHCKTCKEFFSPSEQWFALMKDIFGIKTPLSHDVQICTKCIRRLYQIAPELMLWTQIALGHSNRDVKKDISKPALPECNP